MKKIISLLLVLCCYASTASFCANAKYDKEIIFRDIPWGSTYKEARKSLEDSGINVDTNGYAGHYHRGIYKVDAIRFSGGEIAGFKDVDIDLYVLDPSGNEVQLPLLGLQWPGTSQEEIDAKQKQLNDAFALIKDELVLYGAGYNISYGTTSGGIEIHHTYDCDDFQKLLIKLSYLYGEPDEYEDYSDDNHIKLYYTWNGSNNTQLELIENYYIDSKYHNDSGNISISYEATDIYDDWDQKHQIILEEEWEREEAERVERERREAEEYLRDVLSNTEGL